MHRQTTARGITCSSVTFDKLPGRGDCFKSWDHWRSQVCRSRLRGLRARARDVRQERRGRYDLTPVNRSSVKVRKALAGGRGRLVEAKRKRFSAEEIIGKLREAEVVLSQGQSVGQVVRKLGVSEQTYYRWRRE